MENITIAISEKDYLAGSPLANALFDFGNADLIAVYKNIPTIITPNKKSETKGLWGAVEEISNSLTQFQIAKIEREKIITELKNQLLHRVKIGELIVYGYKHPQHIEDTPVKIPVNMFIAGEINWEKSELKFKNNEFTGIRILVTSQNITKNSETITKTITEKPSFAKLDPELHIDEKKAAEYLGISYRTLQGYRTKGGGPKFVKIGKKTIRYKVSDLIGWSNDNKKINTSE
ncbi:MAG: helix-turn-helix transcriptional regulator [Rickettsiales bacterium]